MVLLPFYRKKLDRSTQFGAVGCIITLFSSKSYVKVEGSVQILGPDPFSGCTHAHFLDNWLIMYRVTALTLYYVSPLRVYIVICRFCKVCTFVRLTHSY